MRQRQLLFLSINRIFLLLYAPLSIALGVFYLFTGNIRYAVLSLGTLIWIALPYPLHRVFHLRTGQLLLCFYYAFILLGYSGGVVLSFGSRIPLYDELIHILGGFFFCIIASAAFCCLIKQRPVKKNLWFANIFCFSFSLAAGFAWELIQVAIMSGIVKTSFTASDMVWNFVTCLLGACIYCILTALYVLKGIHTYPLYAFEDFAALNVKSTVEILSKSKPSA